MKRMTRRTFFKSAGVTAAAPGFGALALAQQAAPSDIKVESDVVFGKSGGTDLRLDIYRPPAGTERRMATIHIHGGGFRAGSKNHLA